MNVPASEIRILDITRGEVQRLYVPPLFKNSFNRGNLYSRVAISFLGYDDDPREVYEIPECRAWMRKLFHQCPQMFYHLTANIRMNVEMVFFCLLDEVEIVVKGTREHTASTDTQEMTALAKEVINKATAYSYKIGYGDERTFEIGEKIVNLIFNRERLTFVPNSAL
jgi:hypothetical protein